MELLTVETDAPRQVIDLTARIAPLASLRGNALCSIFIRHTTAGLALAAVEPGAQSDLAGVLDRLLPPYDYQHLPVDHAPAHVLGALIGASLVVPVSDGCLALGEFQRVVLVELQGPRTREVEVRFV